MFSCNKYSLVGITITGDVSSRPIGVPIFLYTPIIKLPSALQQLPTPPAFRRRESQAAIMVARIAKARELGCTHIFRETGEAVEGDPSIHMKIY